MSESPSTTRTTEKKRRRWPWIVGGIVALFAVVQIASAGEGHAPGPAATQAVDQAPAPVTAAPFTPAPAPAPVVAPPAPAAPKLTASQANALRQAKSYLSHSAFSRSGLIEQLEYEGYPTADATFAVDTVTVDWMDQAAKQARSYLSHSSFSRSGLIDQLEYEGYTREQAEHGATAAGL